jgi:glycosyltransferase involved in cell wall biosynthesis
MAQARQTAAVVIPTYNVASIIRPCLDSVSFADEVIIVDMFSTDETEEVCRSYPNVRFFQRLDYIYGNFNYGVDQATSDWIIKLDSDEVLNHELQQEVMRVLAKPEPGLKGYYFPSVQHMFGMAMRHGVGAPSVTARVSMFLRGTARYQVRAEHEGLCAQGPFGWFKGYYEHYTNHTTSEVIRKFDYYTNKDIDRVPPDQLTAPSVWRIVYRCLRQFIWMYIQMGGYKDGALGFFSSAFRGPVYILIEEAKRWERWRATRAENMAKQPGAAHPAEVFPS